MFARLKRGAEKILTKLVSVVSKLTTLATFLTLPLLFIQFIVYMCKGNPVMCLVCLAGIYSLSHLNKVI